MPFFRLPPCIKPLHLLLASFLVWAGCGLMAMAEESIHFNEVMTTPMLEEKVNQLELNTYGHKKNQLSTSLEQRLKQLENDALAPQVQPATLPKEPLYTRLQRLYAAQSVDEDSQKLAIQLYNQAIDATTQGKTQQAFALYEEALKLHPGFMQASNNLGALLEQKGLYPEASSIYWQALLQHPEEALLYRNLGVAYEKQGLLPDAMEAFKAYLALATQPDPAIELMMNQLNTHADNTRQQGDYLQVTREASNGLSLVWPKKMMPLPIYIGWSTPEQGQYLPLVKEAMQDWERASNGQLRFKVVQNPEMSRLQLVLSDGPLSHPHDNVGHTGYTMDPNASEPLTTLQVRVRVNTGRPDDTDLDEQQRLLAIRRFTLHELGHALGVWGHSSNPADIMFTHPLVNELSLRDTNTVQRMYGIKPLTPAKEQPLSSLSSRWLPEPRFSLR